MESNITEVGTFTRKFCFKFEIRIKKNVELLSKMIFHFYASRHGFGRIVFRSSCPRNCPALVCTRNNVYIWHPYSLGHPLSGDRRNVGHLVTLTSK